MNNLSRRNFLAGIAATGVLAAAGAATGCAPTAANETQTDLRETGNELIPDGYYVREDLKDLDFPIEGEIAFEAADWLLDTVMDESRKTVFPMTGNQTVGGWVWLDSWFTWPGGESGFKDAYERVRDFCIEQGVDLRFNTPGVQLITSESGEVVGAYAKNENGQFIKITASLGTLLATGSYEYNKEMMEKCVRPRDRMAFSWCNPCTGDTGDGHMMGLAIGAAMDDYPHPVMMDNTGARDGSFYSVTLFGTTRLGLSFLADLERSSFGRLK